MCKSFPFHRLISLLSQALLRVTVLRIFESRCFQLELCFGLSGCKVPYVVVSKPDPFGLRAALAFESNPWGTSLPSAKACLNQLGRNFPDLGIREVLDHSAAPDLCSL